MLSQRWLRWGLIAAGLYLGLVGVILFVVTPRGMWTGAFGPVVGVFLIALLSFPAWFFPNPGLEDVGREILLLVPPAAILYFLIGVGLGVAWPP